MSDALINGLAGAGGGIIAQLITYPLQTVNTRQQTDRDPKKKKNKAGTVEQMLQVVQQEGWGRLYSGLAPSLVGTACSQTCFMSRSMIGLLHTAHLDIRVITIAITALRAILACKWIPDGPLYATKGVYYYFYQIFRSKAEATALRRKKEGAGDGSVGMLSSLMVAAMSGCVNVLLTNPIWVVVTRMQTHTKKSATDLIVSGLELPPFATSNAVQEVFGEAGILGFWKGVFPTLVMVSNPSIQFMLYETLLKKLKQRRALSNSNKGVTALEIFLLGALAKLGATVVTYPLLVVKSRLQARQAIGLDKKHQYEGTLDAILKMIRYEGFHGFYKGMSTKIVQSVLAAAVLFMVKEELVNGVRWMLLKDAAKVVKSKSP